MSSKDRKEERTKVLSMTVRYRSANVDEFIENHSHDVSRGGMFIKTKSPFPPGTLLKFEVKIAEDQKVLQGVGRVVWKRDPLAASDDFPAGMGVKFIRLDDNTRQTVERLSENRSAPDSAFEKGAKREGVRISSIPPVPTSPLPSIPTRANADSQVTSGLNNPVRASLPAGLPSIPGGIASARPPTESKSPSQIPLAQRSAGLGVVRIPQISSVPQPRLSAPVSSALQSIGEDIDAMIDAAILPSTKTAVAQPNQGLASDQDDWDADRPSTPWVRPEDRKPEEQDRESRPSSPSFRPAAYKELKSSHPSEASFADALPASESSPPERESRPAVTAAAGTTAASLAPASSKGVAPASNKASDAPRSESASNATVASKSVAAKSVAAKSVAAKSVAAKSVAAAATAQPKKSKAGMSIALSLVALAAVGGGVFVLLNPGQRVAEPLSAPAVVKQIEPPAPPVVSAAPEPEPEPAAEPEPVASAAAEAPSAEPAVEAIPAAVSAQATPPVPAQPEAPKPNPRPARPARPAPKPAATPAPAAEAPAAPPDLPTPTPPAAVPAPAPAPPPPPAPKPAPAPKPDDNPY